jgi:hypothetical protein
LIEYIFLDQYLTYNDLEQTVNTVPKSDDIDEILPIYKNLKGNHRKLIMNKLKDQIEKRDE